MLVWCVVVCCVLCCGVVVCGVVFGVCVCVGRGERDRVYVHNALRVAIHNVPVCTGTTRTCVSTCARGAGIHGDVLNVHTGTCGGTQGEREGEGGVVVSLVFNM